MNIIQLNWKSTLKQILENAKSKVVISSPYVTKYGVDFLINNLSDEFKNKGDLHLITNLSSNNILQKSTDVESFLNVLNNFSNISITHLPKLHSKVYLSDLKQAIITSGNLTYGGLYENFEYGIHTKELEYISIIENDLISYSELGVKLSNSMISDIYKKANNLIDILGNENKKNKKIKDFIDDFETYLIKPKVENGKIHSIFEKTILYILKKEKSLNTYHINQMVQNIHPELCDDNTDRIIDGTSYGKKWKHIVRTAQQNLKKKNEIKLIEKKWQLE